MRVELGILVFHVPRKERGASMNSKDLCQDGMKQFLTSLFCHGSHRKPSYWEGKGSDLRTGKIGKLQVKEPKMEDFLILHTKIYPGGSEVKSVFLQCGRPGFDPWVGKMAWRKEWQLSCCISLCTLFAEPRIGKARAKRLEEDSGSRRNCRHIYSLLSWLMQQT